MKVLAIKIAAEQFEALETAVVRLEKAQDEVDAQRNLIANTVELQSPEDSTYCLEGITNNGYALVHVHKNKTKQRSN